MTTPDHAERIRANLATLMVAMRPEWDIAGCVAALRKIHDLPVSQLTIAAARYCGDENNLTPAHLTDFTNRAWDSDWYLPCKTHPECRARRNSECANCWSDRTGTTEPLPLRRQGTPIPDEARVLVLAAFRKTPDETTGEPA